MSELEWQLSYLFVLRLMATIAVVMLFTSGKTDNCAKQNACSEK
jgi:hypothetical protein